MGNQTDSVGPNVGAGTRSTDVRAPYPDTVWYSFPGSCVGDTWMDKTDECREENPGGVCAFGSEPDGKICTFSYKTLGYLRIDDLVGITAMKHSKTDKYYKDYEEFCKDKKGKWKGIEMTGKDTPPEPKSVKSIPFWEKPFDK
eukprot:512290_1